MNRAGLSLLLNNEGIPPSWYSLYGDLESDKIILYDNYNRWEIFYYDERGGREMLKTCNTEEACNYIHPKLIIKVLASKSIFFSQHPIILPQTTGLIMDVGYLEITIRIWFDSLIYNEDYWSEINSIIFGLKKETDYYQKYTIHLYGSKKMNDNGKMISFSVDAIPYHDWISIKSEMYEDGFEKELSKIIYKCIFNSENLKYKGFFARKKLYVGFRNKIHELSKDQNG